MQGVNAAPRAAQSADAINWLIKGAPSITVQAGAQLVNADLSLGADLSGWLRTDAPPTVESDSTATIHRSCSVTFDPAQIDPLTGESTTLPFNYLSQFVLLYWTFTNNDTGFAARFNMGIYCLSSPQVDASQLPNTWTFDGYDLLSLLDVPIGDTYFVAPSTSIDTAIASLVHAVLPTATINGSTGLTAGGTGLTWPFDESDAYTYLDAINAMLTAGGFLPLWADWNGVFQITAATSFASHAIEYVFDTSDEDNIVAESRSVTNDLSDVPNKWKFIMSGLTAAPVEGQTQYTYTDSRASSPTSTVNRGRTVWSINYVDTLTQDSTSYAQLVTLAQKQIELDLTTSEEFAVSTSPFPLAWHFDSITYNDNNIAEALPAQSNTRHVVALSWESTLDGSADTTWTWQTAVAL